MRNSLLSLVFVGAASVALGSIAETVSFESKAGSVTREADRFIYEHREGTNGHFSVSFNFPDWETDTWVFLPACAYNGNRDAQRVLCLKYPPTCSEKCRGKEPVCERTQYPALNPDGSGQPEFGDF